MLQRLFKPEHKIRYFLNKQHRQVPHPFTAVQLFRWLNHGFLVDSFLGFGRIVVRKRLRIHDSETF
nr:MAG TPA: cytoplasmic domain binding protein [Caudoviricetes sp.]